MTSALRTAGNIVSVNDQQTQMVINSGVLAALEGLLNHSKRIIRKETGTPHQVASLLVSPSTIKVSKTSYFILERSIGIRFPGLKFAKSSFVS